MSQISNDHPAILIQERFQPPYCPNEDCDFHFLEDKKKNAALLERLNGKRFYKKNGWEALKCFPYKARCYQCRFCKRGFRYSTFKMEYRERRRGENPQILEYMTSGMSNRRIAHLMKCSEWMIRSRQKKIAKWGLIKHTELTEDLKIDERISYDGLENFAGTQYDPNHIQHAVGSNSLFIYDFNFVPLNRKGKMSDAQKIKNKILEQEQGRYPSNAIRTATAEIFERLYQKRKDPRESLVLCTDEHFQYKRAIFRDLGHCRICHLTVSSKATRNYQNILFPVNHHDSYIRHVVKAFTRQTIAFAKTHQSMIEKFTLFMIYMNYFRPQFVKPQVFRANANTHSPAMQLGLANKIFKFHEFFDTKRTLKQVKLNREWECFYKGIPTYHRVKPVAA